MRRFACVLVVLLVRVSNGQGAQNAEPHVFLELWIESSGIDCSESIQTVTVHCEGADRLAGFALATLDLDAPTSGQTQRFLPNRGHECTAIRCTAHIATVLPFLGKEKSAHVDQFARCQRTFWKTNSCSIEVTQKTTW